MVIHCFLPFLSLWDLETFFVSFLSSLSWLIRITFIESTLYGDTQ